MKQNLDHQEKISRQLSFSRSIIGKLLVLMVAISVLPVVGFSIYVYLSDSNSNERIVKEEQKIQIQAEITSIEKWINERDLDIATLAGAARVQTMDPIKAIDALKQYFNLWGSFETMFIADTDGMMIGSSNDTLVNISERSYFQQALAGKRIISDPLVSKITGETVIVFASPIISNDQVVGVAGGTVTMKVLEQLIQASATGSTTDIYLINQDGLLITNPRFISELETKDIAADGYLLSYKIDTIAGASPS